MKSLNCSHIKFRNTQKRVNKPPQNETSAIKCIRKKKSVNPVPTLRGSIGSLATSRGTFMLNTYANNSFTADSSFVGKKEEPVIKIEDGYLLEEHSCDPKVYIKSTTYRTNGKKTDIGKKVSKYKIKIAKLEKENLNLKKTLSIKESELKKKNNTKEKKVRKRIKEKLLNFAKSFNKALDIVESMCNVCTEMPDTKRSTSLHSNPSTSSLVTVLDFSANTPINITSVLPSKKNFTSKSTEMGRKEIPVQSIKKGGGRRKTSFRNVKTKPMYKKK